MKTLKHLTVLAIILLSVPGLKAQTSTTTNVSINGRVYYHHYTNFNAGTLTLYYFRDSVTVRLMQGNNVVAAVPINSNGYYQFTNVEPGNYTYSIICNKLWGGVAATDALTILRGFCGIPPILSGLSEKAAHICGHPYYNALDAYTGEIRFVGAINSFPSGDWCWDSISLSIDGSTNITQDIHGLCFGDVNGSYIPLNTILATP